jgi:hypothetical protein
MFRKLFDKFINYVSFSNEDFIIEKMQVKTILRELGINISFCKIHNDLSVDVFTSVDLSFKDLEKIPLQFNNIYGDFDCSFNQLKTLEGCPKTVSGKFSCNNNKLSNFKGCPHTINKLDCYDIGYYEVASYHGYSSIHYSPITRYFGRERNIELDNVLGQYSDSKKEKVLRIGDSRISYNKIVSFEGFPERIMSIDPINWNSNTTTMLKTHTSIESLLTMISSRDLVKYIKYINEYDVISRNYIYVSRLLDVLYLLNINPHFLKDDYFDQMKRYGFKIVEDLDFNERTKYNFPRNRSTEILRSDFVDIHYPVFNFTELLLLSTEGPAGAVMS